MSSRPPPQCLTCAHFRSPVLNEDVPEPTWPDGTGSCDAYPTHADAIPAEIWWNQADHRQPHDGDHGMQFEPVPGTEFLEFALQPQAVKSLAPFESDLDAVLGIADDGARAAALDLLVKHLPGKHDQSSHGRGAGVRVSLKKAKTSDEIAAVVSSEASAIVGDKVTVSMAGADPAVARQFGEGILQGAARYPATPLRQVGTYGPGSSVTDHNERLLAQDARSSTATAIAVRGGESNGAGGTYQAPTAHLPNGFHTTGTAIYLNAGVATPAHFQTRARIRELEIKGVLQGRGAVTVTPRDLALHEFGHSVGKHGRPGLPEYKVGQAARRGAAGRGVDVKTYVQKGVSHYSATDDAELTAEVFADVMANGSRATPLSKELFAVFDTNARGWEAEVTKALALVLDGFEADLWAALELLAKEQARDDRGRFAGGGSPAMLHTEAAIRSTYDYHDEATGLTAGADTASQLSQAIFGEMSSRYESSP